LEEQPEASTNQLESAQLAKPCSSDSEKDSHESLPMSLAVKILQAEFSMAFCDRLNTLSQLYSRLSKEIRSVYAFIFADATIKERLPALLRDLFTFSSKVMKRFIVEKHLNVKRLSCKQVTRMRLYTDLQYNCRNKL
jgi:hypothetical protein